MEQRVKIEREAATATAFTLAVDREVGQGSAVHDEHRMAALGGERDRAEAQVGGWRDHHRRGEGADGTVDGVEDGGAWYRQRGAADA